MSAEESAAYGDRWADVYDHLFSHEGETRAAVGFLAAMGAGGPVLELGIGTGRVALPLARCGLRVRGLDASQAMVTRLRAKLTDEDVQVTLGDMSEVRADERYSLVYCIFNSLFCLPDQEAQTRCFESVARLVRPDGSFVVEAFVPGGDRLDRGNLVRAAFAHPTGLVMEANFHDPIGQVVRTQCLVLIDGRLDLLPDTMRYAWPSELDLMARIAGFALECRYDHWDRSPYTGRSSRHISVYRLAPSP